MVASFLLKNISKCFVFERCFIILRTTVRRRAKGYEIDSKKNFAKQRNVVLLIQPPLIRARTPVPLTLEHKIR